MEIKKRTKDLEEIFDERWKVNNNKLSGREEKLKEEKEKAREKNINSMYNFKTKEEIHEEILEATSVEGQLKRLNESMNTISQLNKRKFNIK